MNSPVHAMAFATPVEPDATPSPVCTHADHAAMPNGCTVRPGVDAAERTRPRHPRWEARVIMAGPPVARGHVRVPLTRLASVVVWCVVVTVAAITGMQRGTLEATAALTSDPGIEPRYIPPPFTELDEPITRNPPPFTPASVTPTLTGRSRHPAFTITTSTPGADAQPPAAEAAARHAKRGHALAAKGRWREARNAYAKAFALAPHPDHAFNLAVTLEHLGDVREALNYYRAARKAARVGPASFDAQRLSARISVLSHGMHRP